MLQHLVNSQGLLEELSMFILPISGEIIPEVYQNLKITVYNQNCSQSGFLEDFYIKNSKSLSNYCFLNNSSFLTGLQSFFNFNSIRFILNYISF